MEIKSIRKPPLFKITGYRFVDGKKVGKEYADKAKMEGNKNLARSIEEAEFMTDLLLSADPKKFAIESSYTGKKDALTLMGQEEVREAVVTAERTAAAEKAAAERAAKKEAAAQEFETSVFTSVEYGDDTILQNYIKNFNTDLIELPTSVADDTRVRNTGGSVFLHGIFQKSVDAMRAKYSAELDQAEAEEVPDVVYKAMLLKANKNSALFEAQALDCVLSLTHKKLEEIIAQHSIDTKAIAKNKTLLNELQAERDEIVDQRNELAILIQTLKNANKGLTHEFLATAHEKITIATEHLYDRSRKANRASAKRAETDLEVGQYKLYIESCRMALHELTKEQRRELHKLVVTVGLSEADVDMLLSANGEIPEKLTPFLPKVVGKLKESRFKQFNTQTTELCTTARENALKEIIAESGEAAADAELMTEQDFDALFKSPKSGTIPKTFAAYKDKVVGKMSKAAFAQFYEKALAQLEAIKTAGKQPGSGEA